MGTREVVTWAVKAVIELLVLVFLGFVSSETATAWAHQGVNAVVDVLVGAFQATVEGR